MEETILNATPRTEFGTRVAKRLRAAGRLPANVYGSGGENRMISLDVKEFGKFFADGHRIATIRLGNSKETGRRKRGLRRAACVVIAARNQC